MQSKQQTLIITTKNTTSMSAGKWILGGLGFVLGGPIGALIGVFIASIFQTSDHILETGNPWESQSTQSENTNRAYSQRRTATVGDIRVSIIVLIACVIKADGKVLKAEVNHIKPFLVRNFGEEGAKDALQLLKQLLQQDVNPIAVSQQIQQHVNYSTRLELLHLLIDLAYADGNFDSAEQQVIETIYVHLGITNADYCSLLALYQTQNDPDWAYAALEITSSATNDEVKHAYRKMAMKYHPDKVANASEEMHRKATEKFRAINQAYKTIKAQRGIK